MRLIWLIILIMTQFSFSITTVSEPSEPLADMSNFRKYYNQYHHDDEQIIYANASNWFLFRITSDDADFKLISKDPTRYFVVEDDTIYYINHNDYEKIYRINTDGSGKADLSGKDGKAKYVISFNVVDDYIYYINSTRRNIYRLSIETGETEPLLDHTRMGFTDMIIRGDWIYYTANHTSDIYNRGLYRMRLDGTDKEQIMDIHSVAIDDNLYGYEARSFLGGTLYAIDIDESRIFYYNDDGIYATDYKGNFTQKLTDSSGNALKAIGNWIYYNHKGEDFGIYRVRKDGSRNEKVADDTHAVFLDVWDNWLFYWGDDFKYKKIRISNAALTDELVESVSCT